jgi:hypothetical protein
MPITTVWVLYAITRFSAAFVASNYNSAVLGRRLDAERQRWGSRGQVQFAIRPETEPRNVVAAAREWLGYPDLCIRFGV